MSTSPKDQFTPKEAGARIVVVGGGFGGAHTVRHMERLFRRRADMELVLVSSDNYFLMTPFLFEACTGTIEIRHCSVPLRAFLRKSRFLEATVRHVDLERRVVHAFGSNGEEYAVSYDQLVLALGSITNRDRIPGSENAFTFKALADALALRNHLIEQFERADAEGDPERKRMLLTVVVIGGGLVGVELLGEVTDFVNRVVPLYPHVRAEEVRFFLLEASGRILPEIAPRLAEYAEGVLGGRPGVQIRVSTAVQSIEPQRVHLGGETIDAATIILAAGILPVPLVSSLPVEKGRHGEIVVDATMRCVSHSEVWALGDSASIPGPDGNPYPALAQHTLREARVLARNVHAVLSGASPQPFVYETKGLMGSLGGAKAFAQIFGIGLRGWMAWWVRRTYYLLQLPGWGRRLHVVIDWTFALLFRPDVVKMDLAGEGDRPLHAIPETRGLKATPSKQSDARR